MRTLTIPARYLPFVEATLAQMVRDVERDEQWPTDTNAPRPVPDFMTDDRKQGTVVVLVSDALEAAQLRAVA